MVFADARVLVTGAASGLGAALVERFRAAGAHVLGTDLAATGDLLRHDITSDDDWAAVAARVEDEWGGLEILVNNAGIAGGGRIEVCTLDEWHRMFEVNLFGLVRGTRTFTPVFKRQGSGRFVNVASLAGLVHPAGMGSYNAAKAAVVAFTETTGHELASAGVKAHAVCPSYFRTNLIASMEGSDRVLGTVMARLVEESSLSADDIASAVLQGIERGDELIVPDGPARAACALKRDDRAAYDAVMRDQAAKLERIG
ncbi:MAG TPA: SDR family NAD(P)-dependent oxidoreductase [Marmoricola sp.]|nr:SDR family NAD(P)-dependent oxidoreductase [Marmoricola sp.]